MTLYVCPAGTSIAKGPLRRGEEMTAFLERLTQSIKSERARHLEDRRGFLIAVSAETNVLVRDQCGSDDEALLLASDSDDGEACANAVADVIRRELGANARVRRIAGLTAQATDSFRQKGIRNLLGAARAELKGTEHNQVVFNVTGGFKGVVPYMTLLGMFEGIDALYVFESSDALIRLPPLPVRFDLEKTAPALPALLLLRNGPLPTAEFRQHLPGKGYTDDPVISQLVEEADGLTDLSAAGDIALSQFAPPVSAGQPRLFVRRAVHDTTLFNNALVQKKLRLIADEGFRRIPMNSARMTQSTDLFICKPIGHSAPRIYYQVVEADIYVVDIISHDEHQFVVQPGERRIWWRDYESQDYVEVSHSPDSGDAAAWSDALSEWLQERQTSLDAASHQVAELDRRVEQQADRIKRLEASAKKSAEFADRAADDARLVMEAAAFAAHAFRQKPRKGGHQAPYVNHLIEVVRILTEAGVTDGRLLAAGYLHDAIEDVGVTGEQIEEKFGLRVRQLVEEVTDDKSLDKAERKRLQIAHAADKSPDARLLSLADKIANLRDLAADPPRDWPRERVLEYFDWARAVFEGLRGTGTPAHLALEQAFQDAFAARPAPI